MNRFGYVKKLLSFLTHYSLLLTFCKLFDCDPLNRLVRLSVSFFFSFATLYTYELLFNVSIKSFGLLK